MNFSIKGLRYHSKSFIHKTAVLDNSFGGEISIGKNTEILNGVLILTYGGNINIGDNCSINPYSVLYGHGGLAIGNNVLIAAHCVIIPANHNFSEIEEPINKQGLTCKGIIIEDDVWLGTGCKILDGVTIGKGSIIGAGSIVTKSIPGNSVFVGNPAKFLKHR